ncbi:MAG: tripartite tricarboxylate transporter substrate binding protein [Betaproteobacteria bacterium PRO3]|nr:tripartite tricarboxylate transporter substrate binding protein [Betaproteobacteria bacterium PRO3]
MTMALQSLRVLLLAAGLAGVPSTTLAQAQEWPARPIQIVVPFVPGGYVDTYARVVAARLGPALGQSVVVENRPGASGNTGSAQVAKAAPDGYTFLVTAINTHAVNLSLYRDLPFHPVRDFTPVALIAEGASAWIVPATVDVSTVDELVALARAQPGKLSYASAGVGTLGHLMISWMASREGIRMIHVPYKGENDALLAALRGDVTLAQVSVASVVPHVAEGRIRVIATTGSTRAAPMPNVPTIAESLPGISGTAWIGMFAPANLPPGIAARVNAEVDRIMTSDEIRQRLVASALVHPTMTPAQFGDFQQAEIAKWAKVVQSNGIRIE